ncbi:MAG: flagellar brake domain-containing protein [Pseudomonadota bacterium]
MNTKNQQGIDLSQRLFIELGTPLLVEARGKINSLSGKLVGMKVGKYLIVDISKAQSGTTGLLEQDPVRVKYVNLEDIFNFSSMVLNILDQPDHLLFLQYPDRVESCNIRSHRRVECFLPIHVKTCDFHAPAIVTNISPEGCLCTIDRSQSWKNINGLQIDLIVSYGELEALTIPGDIRSTQMQGEQIKLGIKFNEIDAFAQSVLTTIVPALKL